MQTIRIVLAIDTPTIRAAVAEFIDICPGLALAGQSGTGAKAFAEAVVEKPDLVLVESPPDSTTTAAKTGPQIFAQLTKQHCPDVKIVLLTAEANNRLAASIAASALDGVVCMRDLPVQLILLIEALFFGRRRDDVTAGAVA
jgi:DNA-binding NarL/FixJ family response regulator